MLHVHDTIWTGQRSEDQVSNKKCDTPRNGRQTGNFTVFDLYKKPTHVACQNLTSLYYDHQKEQYKQLVVMDTSIQNKITNVCVCTL